MRVWILVVLIAGCDLAEPVRGDFGDAWDASGVVPDGVFESADRVQQGPPSGIDTTLTLAAGPTNTVGQPHTFTVTGAAPGQEIRLAASYIGVGPSSFCPSWLNFECADLLSVGRIATGIADGSGEAVLTATAPANAPLGEVWFQAFGVRDRATRLLPNKSPTTSVTLEAGRPRIANMSIGRDVACAVDVDGGALCITGPFGTADFTEAELAAESWTDIAVGFQSTCALDTSGIMHCNGLAAPGGTWSRLSAGEGNQYCGIRTTGDIGCWGTTHGTPPAGNDWVSLDSGNGYFCAIDGSGALGCWGANGSLSPPAGTFQEVSVSHAQAACALRTDGSLVCWGFANTSELGTLTPPPGNQWVDLNVSHNGWGCALDVMGAVSCWGQRSVVLNGVREPSATWDVIADGDRGTGCLADTTGGVQCFFTESSSSTLEVPSELQHTVAPFCGDGTLDPGETCDDGNFWPGDGCSPSCTPQTVAIDTIVSSSTSATHGCVVDADGDMLCWGADTGGVADIPPGTWAEVVTGPGYTCALDTAGMLSCWGQNTWGIRDSHTAGPWSTVDGSGRNFCALDAAGSPTCWGAPFSNTPAAGTYSQISIGEGYGCGVKSDQTVACWGNGLFGSGAPSGTFTEVFAGNNSIACGLTTAGSLDCWGQGGDAMTPPGGSNWVELGGSTLPIAIDSSGGATFWDRNQAPVSLPSGETWVRTTRGDTFGTAACAVTVDDRLYCASEVHPAPDSIAW